jgi:uncharacterized protein (DUF1697 family)
MTTFIALLRGINVGGNRKLAMADLRDLCVASGLAGVRTYVNSGNVVFTATGAPAEQEARIEAAIEVHCGFKVDVMVRSATDWAGYVRGNPFPDLAEKQPNFVMLLVPKQPLSAGDVTRMRAKAVGGERVEAVGEVVWIYYANGSGRSKLAAANLVRTPITTRNWRTVLALDAMAKAAQHG